MTRKSLIPLMMLSVGAIASVAPQGDEPAEKVYKNIKTMTGVPSKEVLPAMHFMSASLKVDCQFCHDPKGYELDTKEEKQTARHMIEMQHKIDADFFQGRNQVTCMTCHNGKSHPASAPVSTGLTRRHTRITDGPKAEDVVAKFKVAMGAAPAAIQLTGSAFHGEQSMGPADLTQTSNGSFLSKNAVFTFGFNGAGYWNQMQGKVQPIPANAMGSFGRFMSPVWASNSIERFPGLTVAGTDKVGDHTVYVLRSGTPATGMEELYFDQITGLLLRDATFTTTVLGTMGEMVDFNDYRKVEGVMVPFEIIQTSATGETNKFKADSAKSVDAPSTLFEMPKAGL